MFIRYFIRKGIVNTIRVEEIEGIITVHPYDTIVGRMRIKITSILINIKSEVLL